MAESFYYNNDININDFFSSFKSIYINVFELKNLNALEICMR